jgi:hypothetical protein
MMSLRITSGSGYGLYKNTISPNISESSDDGTRTADFQRLFQSPLMVTKMPAGMRPEGSGRSFTLMTVDWARG